MANSDPSPETRFKPGESGNPEGRPKKFVSHVLDELQEQGYTNVTKLQVVDIYEYLLALPQNELVKLGEDEEQPMIFRIIVKAMLSKRGFDIIERMIDRAHGRPKNELGLTDTDGAPIALVKFIGTDGKPTKPKTGRG